MSSITDSDVEVLLEQPRSTSWRKMAIGASASLLLCGAVARLSYVSGLSANVAGVQDEFQVVAAPGREFCASTKANCFSKGCCNVEGYNCFTTNVEGQAKCMKSCDPKKYACKQPDAIMEKVLAEGVTLPTQSLYCYAIVTVDTGSPLPSHELDLMNYQAEKGFGVFECEQTGLFSDGSISLKDGTQFTQVHDTDGDWKFAKRKETGAWVNTGLFTSVWKQMKADGKWRSADWVVKVDPDAVFVVPRLKKRLESTYEVASGSYLVNCPYVDYGFFGNLEVISNTGFNTLLENIDVCKADTTINWKVGIKNGKYGPSGEDLFAQQCMDVKGVRRVAAFDLSQDGACESKRDKGEEKNKKFEPHCSYSYGVSLHPFKKVAAWSKCMDETLAAYPKPL